MHWTMNRSSLCGKQRSRNGPRVSVQQRENKNEGPCLITGKPLLTLSASYSLSCDEAVALHFFAVALSHAHAGSAPVPLLGTEAALVHCPLSMAGQPRTIHARARLRPHNY